MPVKGPIVIAAADPHTRKALQDIVQTDHCEVLQAGCGDQALALAKTRSVQAFLLGVDIPNKSGAALCRELRAMEQYQSTPIIFLSENGGAGLTEAIAAGGDDFLQAPYAPAPVHARLDMHLQRLHVSERLDRLHGILKRYVSKRTLEAIDASLLTGKPPQPEERQLAICFTDIRGFTALSENTEPAQLFSMTSKLLADQVNIIHGHGGYVDKFGGDGVMAVFDGPDMVLQSCLCALSILESARLKDSLEGGDIRRVGVGIHTGRAVVGNIGSPEHLDYSAIGSAVNLAARLCGQAEATSIVVSKAVRDCVQDDARIHFHSERQVFIRGFKDPVTIYTLDRREAHARSTAP